MKPIYIFIFAAFSIIELNAMRSLIYKSRIINGGIKSLFKVRKPISKAAIALITSAAAKETLESNMIIQAAGSDEIDKNHPYSVTPVKYGLIKDLGDLATFQRANDEISILAKQDILLGKYTKCPFYTLKKTRLSQGSYQEVGLVIVGSKDNYELCKEAHFQSLAQYLQKVEQWKKENK